MRHSVKAAWLIFAILFAAASAVLIQPPADMSVHRILTSDLIRKTEREDSRMTVRFEDASGNPTFAEDAGYAISRRQLDEQGRTVREAYYDEQDRPVCTASHGAQKLIEYDGETEKITYLDEDGRAFTIRTGYATVVRKPVSDEKTGRRIIEETYYDEEGNPVALELGQYSARKEFDADGQCTVLTFLDPEGNPVSTTAGYTSKSMSYFPDGRIETERYFDENGKPSALADGQYGVRYDARGGIVYLNDDGTDQLNLRRLLYNHSWAVIAAALAMTAISVFTGRKANLILLVLYIGCICYLTLLYREGSGSESGISLFRSFRKIFTDGEARAGIIRNIWLFIPLGTILYRLCPHKSVLLVPLLFSIGIEAIQYYTGTGICEADDVISNWLGGIIGGLTGKALQRIWRHSA